MRQMSELKIEASREIKADGMGLEFDPYSVPLGND